jgi:hypothetical protein
MVADAMKQWEPLFLKRPAFEKCREGMGLASVV